MEGARAVSKALTLLNTFTTEQPWWTLSQLGRATGMPLSTVNRLLSALEAAGAVQREHRGSRYAIGYRTLMWGAVAQASSTLQSLARPFLERLSESTGETAAVYLRQGQVRVCIDVVNSSQPVHRSIRLGEIAPLGVGAAGRVVAAYLPEEEQVALHIPIIERAVLRQVPRQAVVCTIRDRLKDAWALASPLKDSAGEVDAALVLTGPASRFHAGLFATYWPRMREDARALSEQRGAPATALAEYRAPASSPVVFGIGNPPGEETGAVPEYRPEVG
jgi:DNA-binding IclR family transcriptional regulator